MARTQRLTFAPSRCTLRHQVATWEGGRSKLRAYDEDAEVCGREEVELERRVRDAIPALEETLDLIEARGVKLERAAIAGTSAISLKVPPLEVEFSATPRQAGVREMHDLPARFELALMPASRPHEVTGDGFLEVVERFSRRLVGEPRHLQLQRWLELADTALRGGEPFETLERRACAVCGGPSLVVREEWTDDDWHAAHHEQKNTLCTAQPHVVTVAY